MIYHFNTIFSGLSIGQYYNRCCDMVPDGNWICLWDADVMTFHTFGNMNAFFEQAIAENPDVKLFSCVANRIGTHKQRVNKIQDPNPSMKYHRLIAEKRLKDFGTRVRTDTKTVSGLMMLFHKTTWEAVNGFMEEGIAGVDTDFSRKVSSEIGKVGILEGLYVMHYYRLVEGNAGHLFKAPSDSPGGGG
jgi:GT2 family glycosyltransferase